MTNEFTGTIKAISPKGRGSVPDSTAVLIQSPDYSAWQDSQRWFNLADSVNPQYVKRGDCEYKMDNDNVITFVKMTRVDESGGSGGFRKAYSGGYQKPNYNRPFKPYSNPEKDLDIRAQMAVKAAIQLISANNDYCLLHNDKDHAIKPTQGKIADMAALVNGAVESAKILIKNQNESIYKGGEDEGSQPGDSSQNPAT